jgi:hypothetical protein
VQPATEFNLFDELEDEFEEEAMELEPVFPSPAMKHLRRGSADHQLLDFPEFEDKAAIAQRKLAQKKLLDFRTNVHLRPPNYRKLILTARLHPFPGRSRVISSFPVPNYGSGLLSLVLEGFLGSTEPGELVQEVWAQILHELRAIADRKFAREIAAENRLTNDAADVIKVHLKKLKPVLLEAAMFDQQILKMKPEELSNDLHKLGLRLAGELGLQFILDSELNEAHLTLLGYRFTQDANTLQNTDTAFRKRVQQERRRRRP